MRDDRVKRLALGGLLSSLVLLTTWQLKIFLPIGAGYIHLGDGVIFLSSMLLGKDAALIAAIGSVLADLLVGASVYIPATLVIKAFMGFVVAILYRPGKHIKNLCAFFLAEAIMVGGYFAYEIILSGWGLALTTIGPNLLQAAAGVALGLAFSIYLPNLKKLV